MLDFGGGWDGFQRLTAVCSFTFNLSYFEQDFPKLQVRLRYGAQILRWDIFEVDWKETNWGTYPPIPGKGGFVGMAATWVGLVFFF